MKRRMDATGVRVQLISPPRDEPPSRCFLAGDPQTGPPWLAALPFADLTSVLELDFSALALGRCPADAALLSEPLYIVCANDKSDPCCGRTGPVVHAAVAKTTGNRCRRTAHVGGHKYASNMVVFPYALFYGRLDSHSAIDVVRANENGLIYLDRFRGRSRYRLSEQAAEHFLRAEKTANGLDAVIMLRPARDLGDSSYATTFALGDQIYETVVTARRNDPPRLQSCTDIGPTVPIRWILEEIKPVTQVVLGASL
jgi:hypothetical protein